MHDFNGGVPLNGLFWTVELPRGAFSFREDGSHAALNATALPINDTFVFGGTNVVPASVSFSVQWTATGPPEQLGFGGAVGSDDPGAFLGSIAPARAEGQFEGKEIGFAFSSSPGANSDLGYAELGAERNGSFL